MKRLLLCGVVVAGTFVICAPADAVRVYDPTPNQAFSDGENQGYVEVASDDGSGALLRLCNENPNTPAGDRLTGYIWVNPSGEDTDPSYGNEVVGAGDEDGEDGTPPTDGDSDTSDDCPPGDGPSY